MTLNQNEDAMNLLEKALKIDPNNPEAHNNLGVLLYRMNKYDLAQKEYLEAIKIRSTNPEAHSNCGVIFCTL